MSDFGDTIGGNYVHIGTEVFMDQPQVEETAVGYQTGQS